MPTRTFRVFPADAVAAGGPCFCGRSEVSVGAVGSDGSAGMRRGAFQRRCESGSARCFLFVLLRVAEIFKNNNNNLHRMGALKVPFHTFTPDVHNRDGSGGREPGNAHVLTDTRLRGRQVWIRPQSHTKHILPLSLSLRCTCCTNTFFKLQHFFCIKDTSSV